jgi:HK97 family phage portal protein
MTLISRLKAFLNDNPSKVLVGSSASLLGRDVKRPDFSHAAAVAHCRSWVYAAARLNAIAVASQPLRLYVRRRDGAKRLWNTRRTGRRTKAYLAGDLSQLPSRHAMTKAAEFGDDYEIVTENHPVLELLSKVNPYQNGFDATVLRVLYTELTGNAYLHPVLSNTTDVPVQLWTLPSQWVEIVPGDPRRGEPFIRGYRYGATEPQKVDFAPEEIIQFKLPNPGDMYYGLGKVEAAWGAVTSNVALHEMDYFFFQNKSRPDYLVVAKGNASEEELDRFSAEVENKLRGTKKTGKFLAVTGDIDLKPLQFPPKDLQGRDEVVEEIAAVFGVPVSMLRANDPNLASATVGFASWKETTVLPMLRMDEEVLNQSLLPLFGIEDDAFLAYDNPVKADEAKETSKRLSYVQGGILTANEAREMEGL